MKKLFMILCSSLCILTMFSCQSQSEEMKLLGNLSEISISKSNGYGGLNENYFTSIHQAEAIVVFKEVLQHAKEKNQNVEVTNGKPDYDIVIRYDYGDTHGLHLRLGNAGEESIVTYIGHEKIGYIISPEDTNKIRNFFDVQ